MFTPLLFRRWSGLDGNANKSQTTDKLFLSLSISILFVLSILLYFDVTKDSGAGGQKIGSVRFKKNTAKRRLDGKALWDRLENRQEIYNGDTIRTGNESEAEIILDNGIRIALQDESLVHLRFEDKKVQLNYDRGNLRIHNSSEQQVEVVIDNKTIQTHNASLNINSNKQDSTKVDVQIEGGTGKLIQGESETVIDTQSHIEISDKQANIKTLPWRNLTPRSGDTIFTESKTIVQTFEWTGETKALLEIYKAGNTVIPYVTNTITVGRATISLPMGKYLWRLRSHQRTDVLVSPLRPLNIIQVIPPLLLSPPDLQTLSGLETKQLVHFSWSTQASPVLFALEIANDSQFDNKIIDESLTQTSVGKLLNLGTYFWRVSVLDPDKGRVRYSQIRKLTIQQRTSIAAPRVHAPKDQEIIPHWLAASGTQFLWEGETGSTQHQLEIALDDSFSKIVRKTNSTNNFAVQTLNPGRYHWRVKTFGKETASSYSAPRSFSVQSDTSFDTFSPPQGDDYTTVRAKHPGVFFSWKPIDYRLTYILKISTDTEFKNTVTQLKTENTSAIVPIVQEGNFYWKIEAVSNTKKMAESKVKSFSISNRLNDPEPIFPRNGQTVDLTHADFIVFKWSSVASADFYVFRLFSKQGDLLLENQTNATSIIFTDFAKLDSAIFSWSVVATKHGPAPKNGRLNSFEFRLPPLPSPRILSPLEQIIN